MNSRILIIGAVVVGALVLLASMTFYVVTPVQQALVLRLGDPKEVNSEPGLYVKLPFIENVVYIDRRVMALNANPEEVIASDQKRLVVDVFLRYRIVNPLDFYKAVGTIQAAESRLSSILGSSVRQVLGSQPFGKVLSAERAALMRDISALVDQEATKFGIQVVDVRIRRADLPVQNSKAIYDRMKTEREREAREFRAQGQEQAQRIRSRADRERTVIVAEAQRDSEITRGEGDANAIRIFAEAFGRDPQFFTFYRSMQAYRKALGKDTTTMVLSPDSEFFRFFDTAPSRASPGSIGNDEGPSPRQRNPARAPAAPAAAGGTAP